MYIMPKTKNKNYIPKTITIRKDQQEVIDKKALNLSRFVQNKLDEVENEGKD